MKLDHFESVFRSSVKERYQHNAPTLERGLFVCDVPKERAELLCQEVQRFLGPSHSSPIEWTIASKSDFSEVSEILDMVRRNPPSLVACYRHILGQGAKLPYSLGSTVDTLTQATDVPVLVLPRPEDDSWDLPKKLDRVMVVTNHLTGDANLVNWAVHLCPEKGRLYLTHIEDESSLHYYLDACSKIPGLPYDALATKLPEKLLAMPEDYIKSIQEVLSQEGIQEEVQSIVKVGQPIQIYKALVAEEEIDLLVVNTKDEGQSAMAGLAYALAVDLREKPLLLL